MVSYGFFFLINGILVTALSVLWHRSLKHVRETAMRQEILADEKRLEAEKISSALQQRFSSVIDIENEKEKIIVELSEVGANLDRLRDEYKVKKEVYDNLLSEVSIFDERLSFAELGVYEPHFDYSDSTAYKDKILEVRAEQKDLITHKAAVICNTVWSLNGNTAKGTTMTNRGIRLTLRAFNNECDVAIANVRWNNVNAMEKRIERACAQIDKLNESNNTIITKAYFYLKIKELRLTHEYREHLKSERDDKAEALRLAREEQKLLRDMENAVSEEERYQALLDEAKREADEIVGPQLDVFAQQIARLEHDLDAARAKVARARAMAERTRSGYVYIISNIGSFGDGVVKIGLTRRLDPMDRVRELGDASVPFIFDTHAMIYSDDAPALERALHTEFDATRLNAQNYRKEFFRASLKDVECAVKRLAPNALFYSDIEAQEYRETLSRRERMLMSEIASETAAFPASL